MNDSSAEDSQQMPSTEKIYEKLEKEFKKLGIITNKK